MRYVAARIQEYDRDTTYRIYVSDGLKAIGGLNMRWWDFVSDSVTTETRTADEIRQSIKDKLSQMGGE